MNATYELAVSVQQIRENDEMNEMLSLCNGIPDEPVSSNILIKDIFVVKERLLKYMVNYINGVKASISMINAAGSYDLTRIRASNACTTILNRCEQCVNELKKVTIYGISSVVDGGWQRTRNEAVRRTAENHLGVLNEMIQDDVFVSDDVAKTMKLYVDLVEQFIVQVRNNY